MNKERMKKLADFIRDLPRVRFNMGNFVEWADPDADGDHSSARGNGDVPKTDGCNTRMCIAGWATFLAGEHLTNRNDIPGIAARWLGLTSRQSSYLFYGEWGDYYNDEGKIVTFMDWPEDRLSNTERAAEAIEAMIAGEKEGSWVYQGRGR